MENLPEDANPSSSINTKSYDESRDDSDFAVFLGDLNKDASEDDIRSILEKYGNVVDVNIMKSKQTGHPLGYGFAKFSSIDEVNNCILSCVGAEIKGRVFHVHRAQRNCKLKITKLGQHITVDDINTTFQEFGDIITEDTTITNSRQRSAVVHFINRKDAADAKHFMNGQVLLGCIIQVDWYRSGVSPHYIREGQGGGGGGGSQYSGVSSNLPKDGRPALLHDEPVVSVHVRFVSSEKAVDEEVIAQAFSAFGTVTEIAIKSMVYNNETQVSRGYAFVHFEVSVTGRNAAYMAVMTLGNALYEGVYYISQLSRNFQRIESSYFCNPIAGTTGKNSSFSGGFYPQVISPPPQSGMVYYPENSYPVTSPGQLYADESAALYCPQVYYPPAFANPIMNECDASSMRYPGPQEYALLNGANGGSNGGSNGGYYPGLVYPGYAPSSTNFSYMPCYVPSPIPQSASPCYMWNAPPYAYYVPSPQGNVNYSS